MLYLIIALIVLGIVAALIAVVRSRQGHIDEVVTTTADCGTCNGENTKCEQECMMEAATKPIEYYDDEELDRFRGTASDNYSDEDADMFADVLYTMRSDEVAGWCRSLHLRGVELPDQLKDEVTMMISEAATAAQP